MSEYTKEITVLYNGYVRYVDNFGTDKRIVEAARISYKSPSKGDEQDKKLLFYLYKCGHNSPFEQCNITYNIRMPIFVMRQFVRHRTFRLNEMSARYMEMKDDFYIPENWRKQDAKNKQGSIDQGDWNPIIFPAHKEVDFDARSVSEFSSISATDLLFNNCQVAYSNYKKLIDVGVAKEMARMILPVNLYTEIYVNCDLHNLIHFFHLRLDAHAQWEIRQFAEAMFVIFKDLYPWTAEAFEKFKIQIIENVQQTNE